MTTWRPIAAEDETMTYNRFEPMLERLRAMADIQDPIQSYCAVLQHRYLKSCECRCDVGMEAAFQDWLAVGRPDYIRAAENPRPAGMQTA